MAFRGLLQDKEREVLHSGPGGGTYHLYEGGVQAVLGQHQSGRTGYRDGARAGHGDSQRTATILPFLTQSLVDTGIRDNNLGFITLILISQLVIFIAKLSVDFIRSWILLHVNTRINIALISDFLAKLMRLPLHFFDTKMVGDIMQRIGDHDRIEAFMTYPSRLRRKPPQRL